jgi:hypothetical protein
MVRFLFQPFDKDVARFRESRQSAIPIAFPARDDGR